MVINPGTYAQLGMPQRRAKRPIPALPLLHRKILALLSVKETDAHGYATIQLPGYTVAEVDAAIGSLHHDGLLNAFFIGRSAQPRFHPSSLTREGRRVHDRLVRRSAS